MKVTFLSSKSYDDSSFNYGDCIFIDTGSDLVIYDCGSEEHAYRVMDYMEAKGYCKAKLVLSHNDADHFDGIPLLVERGYVADVYTLLLLKYKDELLDLLDDGRITRNSLTKRIEEIFDNIYSLGGSVNLHDMFTDCSICSDITIVGPDKDYALNAVAKRIDSREGDTIDKETIVNAVSCQVKVNVGSKQFLLCGDSNYEAIKDKLSNYHYIQLPHHGKLEHAKKIFADKDPVRTVYYVSDNTGDSNGGSSDLPRSGQKIRNTLNGDQVCTENTPAVSVPRRTLGYYK